MIYEHTFDHIVPYTRPPKAKLVPRMLLVGGATPAGPRARDPRRYKVCGSTFASCVRLRDPRGARAAAGDVLYLLPDRLTVLVRYITRCDVYPNLSLMWG